MDRLIRLALLRGCLGIGAALAAMPAHAAAPVVDCSRATATAELNYCAEQESEREDKRLNEVYSALRKTLDPQGQTLLRDTQRAWIPFRDLNCSLAAHAMQGGTGASVAYLGCLARMSRERADELSAELQKH